MEKRIPKVWYDSTVFGELTREMSKGFRVIKELARNLNQDIHVTSIRDGVHSAGSLHPQGDAIDLWWNTIKMSLELVKKALGNDFDVVDEGNPIHIEYDPK